MATKANHPPLLRVLLACGVLSSAVYVASDVVGALSYPGYDYAAQAISEMSAVGAPTTKLLAPFYRVFSFLFVAFAAGVWLKGSAGSYLRRSAAFMAGVAVVGIGLSVFPMNPRGAERTLSDTMHLLFSGATMMLLSATILTGAKACGRRFRRYSVGTVIVMLVFFAITLLDAPRVAADLPTPYMGLNERACMAAWLLWIAVFSAQLQRSTPGPFPLLERP